ncbi:MAG: rhodanese-like domain-containing protein [Ignavibacteriaceae bacterium]|jgi:adenylyltransferase/sulfurtransferase|nr:rhodanese-like domain-containing protein [Ignavibacteriaceae bacterium]
MRILKQLFKPKSKNSMIRNLNPYEVKEILDSGEKVRLIDVREEWENNLARIEGCELFPLSKFNNEYDKLGKDETLIVYCHHGNRSMTVCNFLLKQGYSNLVNLRGGIALWALTVDPKIKQY